MFYKNFSQQLHTSSKFLESNRSHNKSIHLPSQVNHTQWNQLRNFNEFKEPTTNFIRRSSKSLICFHVRSSHIRSARSLRFTTSTTEAVATPLAGVAKGAKQNDIQGQALVIPGSATIKDSACVPDGPPIIPSNVVLPAKPPLSAMELIKIYASLSKFRLGSLVVVTTMVGYIMAPAPFVLSTFAISSIGTGLAVASANTLNQVIEVEHDSKMVRTRQRMLPSGIITTRHATIFAIATGLIGGGLLFSQVNPLSAALAVSNIALYAGIYTPLKRLHPVNTIVGAVVGAIPPLIGWCAATGGLEPGAWVIAGLLYLWQIPHFHSLSWRLVGDYQKAGYKMLCNLNPEKVPPTALRWSIYMLPLAPLCYLTGMTTGIFALDSLAINGYLLYHGWKFYKESNNANARKLFFATIFYLPVFLALMIFHKDNYADDDEEQKEEEEEKQ